MTSSSSPSTSTSLSSLPSAPSPEEPLTSTNPIPTSRSSSSIESKHLLQGIIFNFGLLITACIFFLGLVFAPDNSKIPPVFICAYGGAAFWFGVSGWKCWSERRKLKERVRAEKEKEIGLEGEEEEQEESDEEGSREKGEVI